MALSCGSAKAMSVEQRTAAMTLRTIESLRGISHLQSAEFRQSNLYHCLYFKSIGSYTSFPPSTSFWASSFGNAKTSFRISLSHPPSRIRTYDRSLKRRLLYQLSYGRSVSGILHEFRAF